MHISKNKTKQEFLTPPPSDALLLKSEFNKRRREFQEKRIPIGDVAEHLEQGWLLEKQDVKRAKVKRRKPIDERLENRFWCSMYRLGYKELSSGRNFDLPWESSSNLK